MTKILFELGTMNKLSLAEVQAIFGDKTKAINDQAAAVELEEDLDLTMLMNKLGGTIKIANVIQECPADISDQKINDFLTEYFLSLGEPKVHFTVGEIGRDHLERFDLITLKSKLQNAGLKVRFNDGSRSGAKAALILNCKKLQEILLVQGEDALVIAKTQAVQDIDDWTLRDRQKPYADHKKGMLPPKLARIMTNLALGSKILEPELLNEKKIYDPFCGTATVLMEAAFYGLELIGSDLDVKAVFGAKENLEWLNETYKLGVKHKVFTKDVTKVLAGELGGLVNYIVTEPFLGRQTPKSKELTNIFRGLEKLYWGAFRHWRELLKDGSKITIVFPQVKADNGKLFTLDGLLDKLEVLGYNKQSEGLIYARPKAIVEREICVFEYNKKD